MLRVLPPLLTLALTIYAVVDCVQTEEEEVRNLPKLVWVLLVLIFPVAGPVAWFFAGRPSSSAPRRGPTHRGGPPRGPDDDPDFLRNL